MLYIVDRIEGDMLVLEGEAEAFFEIPRALLPEAREGDCIEIAVNSEETKKRRESVRRLMEELFEN